MTTKKMIIVNYKEKDEYLIDPYDPYIEVWKKYVEEQMKFNEKVENTERILLEQIKEFFIKEKISEIEWGKGKDIWGDISWGVYYPANIELWRRTDISPITHHDNGKIGGMNIYFHTKYYQYEEKRGDQFHIAFKYIDDREYCPETSKQGLPASYHDEHKQLLLFGFRTETIEEFIQYIGEKRGLQKVKDNNEELLELKSYVEDCIAEDEWLRTDPFENS